LSELWIPADWPAPPGVVAGCTTRFGGVSEGTYASLNLGAHTGDDPVAVSENRRRFVDKCGLPAEPGWLTQVHGNDIVVDPSPGTEADAAITNNAGTVCTVMIADCLPVLLASDDGSEVAAAHAGWRGLAAGVLENAAGAFTLPASRLLAWLGPAISQPAFEVGAEVRQVFTDYQEAAAPFFVANDRDRWQADIFGLARLRLENAGVLRIFGGALCTYSDADRFFSYRRDGQCGRMAGFIFRRN